MSKDIKQKHKLIQKHLRNDKEIYRENTDRIYKKTDKTNYR